MSRYKGELSEDERAEYASQVKTLRQAKNLTQRQLADLANVSRATINTLESGSTTPQTGKLTQVLAVLGVDLGEPQFDEQTQLWLSMMGTMIEAIPEPRRLQYVNAAIRKLSDGLKSENAFILPGGSAK